MVSLANPPNTTGFTLPEQPAFSDFAGFQINSRKHALANVFKKFCTAVQNLFWPKHFLPRIVLSSPKW